MTAAPHSDIARAIHDRTLVLDGATGTMLRDATAEARLPVTDLLCLCPSTNEAVINLHRAYLDAGADIIRNNTINANTMTLQRMYGVEDADSIALKTNRIAAQNVRQCIREATAKDGRQRYAAGVVSPIYMKDSTDRHDYEDACEAQMTALAESGVDVLLAESCYDLPGTHIVAQVATRMAERYDTPIIFSATVNKDGVLPTGGTLEDFLEAVAVARPIAVGLNCCEGPGNFVPVLRRLKAMSPYPAIAYPSAGLADSHGRYTATPGDFAQMARLVHGERLAQIIGGCCGTTPAHIAAIAQAVAGVAV